MGKLELCALAHQESQLSNCHDIARIYENRGKLLTRRSRKLVRLNFPTRLSHRLHLPNTGTLLGTTTSHMVLLKDDVVDDEACKAVIVL